VRSPRSRPDLAATPTSRAHRHRQRRAGNLYFDEAGTTIWKVAIASAALTKIAGTAGQYGSLDEIGAAASFNGPTAIAADGVGNIYVTDAGNATIRKIVLATKAVTTLAGLAGAYGTADGIGAAARFNYPISITSDGAGHLYVAETNVIRKIVIATATVSTIIGAPNRLGCPSARCRRRSAARKASSYCRRASSPSPTGSRTPS
jgi:hypothetical protein